MRGGPWLGAAGAARVKQARRRRQPAGPLRIKRATGSMDAPVALWDQAEAATRQSAASAFQQEARPDYPMSTYRNHFRHELASFP